MSTSDNIGPIMAMILEHRNDGNGVGGLAGGAANNYSRSDTATRTIRILCCNIDTSFKESNNLRKEFGSIGVSDTDIDFIKFTESSNMNIHTKKSRRCQPYHI
jgi:hypothetical protein